VSELNGATTDIYGSNIDSKDKVFIS
jgi:hypothetical protein